MQSRLAFTSFLILLGAGLAHAAISLSSGCVSTLLTAASSNESSCFNVADALTGLLNTPANSSLVTPGSAWLAGACSQDACTNQSLSAIVTNLTSGCTTDDLSSIGFSGSPSDIISTVQGGYPTVRRAACLKETSNNTLCAVTLYTEIETAENSTLSVGDILSIGSSIVFGGQANLPSYITCSDCVKQAYNVLVTDQPAVGSNTTVNNAFSSQCGSNFTDGAAVTGVVEGTGTAAPTPTGDSALLASGAAGLVSGGVLTGIAVSSLAALSSAFLVLA